eukprot:1160311-Pelagomonas_calceolata.AAC.4
MLAFACPLVSSRGACWPLLQVVRTLRLKCWLSLPACSKVVLLPACVRNFKEMPHCPSFLPFSVKRMFPTAKAQCTTQALPEGDSWRWSKVNKRQRRDGGAGVPGQPVSSRVESQCTKSMYGIADNSTECTGQRTWNNKQLHAQHC